jgi:Tfp pilus assembly PilM family ATPase
MSSDYSKPYLGLALRPDYFSVASVKNNAVDAAAFQELGQSFDLHSLREGNFPIHYFVEVLTNLVERAGSGIRPVGISLDGSMALVKKVSVALGLEEELLNDQMAWEAEQVLVSPLDQFSAAFQRLPFSTVSGNPLYVQVLVRKKVIETVQALVRESGLRLADVDVDVFSTIRAIVANHAVDPRHVAVCIDAHRDHMGMTFIRKNEYFLSHRIPVPKQMEDVSDRAKLLFKELRRLIFGHGLGKGIEDVHRFFLVNHVSHETWNQELSKALSIPVEPVRPFQKIAVSSRLSNSMEYSEFPERFVASVGVALKKFPALAQ